MDGSGLVEGGWGRDGSKLRNGKFGPGTNQYDRDLFVKMGFRIGRESGRSRKGTPGQKLKNRLKLSCVVQRRCEQRLDRG